MAGRVENREINAFLTTTLGEYAPNLNDNIFDDVPGLSYMRGSLGRLLRGMDNPARMLNGGERIYEPLLYGKNSTASSYADAEVLDTTLQDGMTNAAFDWKQYSVSVGITGKQKRANRGKYALIKLLDAKVMQAEMTLQEQMNEHFYLDGSGNNSKNLDGLGLIISTTSTLGGITVAARPEWVANVTSSVGSFVANGRKKMANLFNTLTIGKNSPQILLTTQAIYEAYEESMVESKRFSSDKVADAGFQNLTFKGVPMVYDRDCPSGEMHFLNGKYIKFAVHTEADMTPSPFQTPENQDVSTSMILWQGNTTTGNRRRLGKLEGITTT